MASSLCVVCDPLDVDHTGMSEYSDADDRTHVAAVRGMRWGLLFGGLFYVGWFAGTYWIAPYLSSVV